MMVLILTVTKSLVQKNKDAFIQIQISEFQKFVAAMSVIV